MTPILIIDIIWIATKTELELFVREMCFSEQRVIETVLSNSRFEYPNVFYVLIYFTYDSVSCVAVARNRADSEEKPSPSIGCCKTTFCNSIK